MRRSVGRWADFIIYVAVGVFSAACYAHGPSPSAVSVSTATTATISPPVTATGAAGMLRGIAREIGLDFDHNDLFEFLEIDLQIDVPARGEYWVEAILKTAEGDRGCSGSVSLETTAAPLHAVVLESGLQTLPVYFEARCLRYYQTDGPYTLNVSAGRLGAKQADLSQPIGWLDAAEFVVAGYPARRFQGTLVEVVAISDSIVAGNLRVAVEIDMLVAGDVVWSGWVFAGEEEVTHTAEQTQRLQAGRQTLYLEFAGEAFSVNRRDGPYEVFISLYDVAAGPVQHWPPHTTAAYRYTDFVKPAAYLADIEDAGGDADNDGIYNELIVTATVVATRAGTYSVHGILEDGQGEFITAGDATATLAGGEQISAGVSFDGRLIGRHGTDGPYRVTLAVVDAGGSDIDGKLYITRSYSAADFKQAEARLTGRVEDFGVDTDADGFYNRLRVAVEVEVMTAGEYALRASLMTKHEWGGEAITRTETTLFLDAGASIVNLDFSGPAIRAAGEDGPYEVSVIELLRAGEERRLDFIFSYDTAAYAAADFDDFGMVRGTVMAGGRPAARNAYVYIAGGDIVVTDQMGGIVCR